MTNTCINKIIEIIKSLNICPNQSIYTIGKYTFYKKEKQLVLV